MCLIESNIFDTKSVKSGVQSWSIAMYPAYKLKILVAYQIILKSST